MNMRQQRFLIIGMSCLLLAACASSKEELPPPSCPQVAIVRALDRFKDYGSDTPDPSNLVAVGFMQDVGGKCSFSDKGVQMEFEIIMKAQKGKRLGGDKIGFPYFISIVDAEDKVISKEIMTARFKLDDDKVTTMTEPLRVFIPLKEGQKSVERRVLIGFQVPPSQVKAP